jgi:UDP-3-O-[3-hydroxymyristoyl] glucosamine N-acyltransferase
LKKYKLGPKDTISRGGTFVRVHRITALMDIATHGVKAGDSGGWVESRRTLSHDGDCWIGENAVVADACRVKDNALVTDNATLLGKCDVSGNSIIKDNAFISGPVNVRDNAIISGKASIISPEYYGDASGYDISGNAQITGTAQIAGLGYIKDSALITEGPKIHHLKMSGNAVISGTPTVKNCILEDAAQIFDSAEVWTTILKGNAAIYGQASILKGDCYTLLTDNVKIFGHAIIYGSRESRENSATSLSGDASVYDNATVKEGCTISGASIINEYAHLLEFCTISGNSRISGPMPLPARYTASDVVQDDSGIKIVQKGIKSTVQTTPRSIDHNNRNANYLGAYTSSPISSALKKTPSAPVEKTVEAKPIAPIRIELAEIIAKVEKDYDDYRNDVVKLIKYPTMVDLRDELTLNFTFALRKAKREVSHGQNAEKMENSVETLERAFLAAEANARKIGPSNYSDQEVRKTETAKQMLAVALDQEASENERRVSFKRAFKTLEGIIAVPDSAVETMKMQVGLKELEA